MDLSTLNAGQRAAVTAADGPHRVIAGAGTGKTRTLVHRVAWLIENGVPPAEIVLLTFTRRAAREMLRRASKQVGVRAHGVRGGTFHGFAHRTLRRHAERIGRTPQFTVLDRSDAEELVGLVRASLGFGGRGKRRFPRARTLLKMFSSAVNTGRTLEATVADGWPRFKRDVAAIEQVRQGYESRKERQDCLDFDDLLVKLGKLLSSDREALATIAGGCRHVLVDEYQDVNKLQARIACLLGAVHGNLMVVGDEAQSIYAFRGAAVEHILEFDQLFPSAVTTMLTENYRSTHEVLGLANGVLDSFTSGIEKQLSSCVGHGPVPRLIDVEDEDQQADLVVRRVLELREEGVDLESQAVLARSAFQLHALEVALGQANIPFRKYGGLKLTESAHVKDVLALLRVALNPRDELAWVRVLPWCENVGRTTAQRLADARGEGKDAPLSSLTRRKAPELDVLEREIAALEPLLQDPLAALAAAIDTYRPFMVRLYDDADDRARDLDSLMSLAERYRDVSQMVSELALEPPSSADADATDDDEQLTLSTVHSAKGLEWRGVFVVGLGDGGFPSSYALDSPAAIEEERRLLYVAVTRAKRHLVLTRPRFLSSRRGPVFSPGCSLIDDIADIWSRVEPGWDAPDTVDVPPALDPQVADRLARFADYFGSDN